VHVEVHFGAPLDFSGRARTSGSAVALREVTEVVRRAVERLFRTGVRRPLRALTDAGALSERG